MIRNELPTRLTGGTTDIDLERWPADTLSVRGRVWLHVTERIPLHGAPGTELFTQVMEELEGVFNDNGDTMLNVVATIFVKYTDNGNRHVEVTFFSWD